MEPTRKMNCISTIRILIAVLMLLSVSAHAQKAKLKIAKRHYDAFNFAIASDIYKDILTSPKHKEDSLPMRMVADCEKRLGNYSMAQAYLEKIATLPFAKTDDLHNLADVYRIQKKYPEVLETYKRILALNPHDGIAQDYMLSPNFVEEITKDSVIYKIRASKINSAASDFAPGFFAGSKLIFSSSRGQGIGSSKYYNWNNQPYLNIYRADIMKDTTLDQVTVLNKDVNSRYHEGTISYDPVNQLMYLTRNNFVRGNLHKSKNGRVNLAIYTTTYKDEKWGDLVPFEWNNKEYSVGHPTLSSDGQRIYFASDMPGGQGGTDIYFCQRLNDQWGKPQNLGDAVNTAADEMFPYLVSDSMLYFSSNGHVGLGGFDLYYFNLYDPFSRSMNLGYPLNSNFDDISALIYPGETAGFFCSNRPGGKGDDDIYEFFLLPPDFVEIEGKVVEHQTLNPIAGATVMVANDDGSFIEAITDEQGKYTMRVPYKPIIKLDATKEDFESGTVSVPLNIRQTTYRANDITMAKEGFVAIGKVVYDIDGEPAPGTMVRILNEAGEELESTEVKSDGSYKVPLPENEKVTIEVTRPEYIKLTREIDTRGRSSRKVKEDFRLFKLEKGTVVRLDNIYYDYGKADIRPDAAKELDKLVQILVDNPTMKIELSSHTDARGSDSYNMTLSDKRAKSAVKYIISQGIDASRLVAKGYGETKLLNKCGNNVKCTEEEHQFNRRTEFKILDV
jgi:outer membrane protein OmpA-like peptidoglycan-associated protein